MGLLDGTLDDVLKPASDFCCDERNWTEKSEKMPTWQMAITIREGQCIIALVDPIIGAEIGGDPNARNPHWSASGASRFIGRTWLDMLRQHRGEYHGL
jgi:hypothetical protein